MTLTKDFKFCVGLDIAEDCDKYVKARDIIEKTWDLVDYYKINPAFYLGPNQHYLYLIADFLHSRNIPWIYDGKLGDIGNTSERYAEYVYDYLKADATTLNPYLGLDALDPFLRRKDKINFLLCRTSNTQADVFQNHSWVRVSEAAKRLSNVGLVVACNRKFNLESVRRTNKDSLILSPGLGAQKGVIEYKDNKTIYSASRSIINAKDYREAVLSYLSYDSSELFYKIKSSGCIKSGQKFVLSNGATSEYYIDLRSLSSNVSLYRDLIKVLSSFVSKDNSIVGVESAGISYATSIGNLLDIPFGYVRKAAKEYGTSKLVEGNLDKNRKVTIIEDVITSGKSVCKAIQAARSGGYQVDYVICTFLRDPQAIQNIESLGVKLIYLFKL
jgi:orotidine 5'-phosphate decarboxylase subfamily 2